MILAVDVGNTNIVLGCIDKDKNYFVARMSTDYLKTADQYAAEMRNIISLYEVDTTAIHGAIISSVVPPLSNTLKEAISKIISALPIVVGPGIKTGLNILIDNPAQLGSDLVVNAVAAIYYYSYPAVIFDMGTATTISVIDKNGFYIGGCIMPGVKISLEALSSRTAQLPGISLEPAKNVIGKNTIDCMRSGVINGSAAMLDGMLSRIEGELGYSVKAVATGGLAQFIVPNCKSNIICDNDLMLRGLFLIYEKNK